VDQAVLVILELLRLAVVVVLVVVVLILVVLAVLVAVKEQLEQAVHLRQELQGVLVAVQEITLLETHLLHGQQQAQDLVELLNFKENYEKIIYENCWI
jgi:predicted PurR-regulated permease PerM